jgi:hypothetical protein
VTIIDIPAWRLLVDLGAPAGVPQLVLAPGTTNNIATAVNQMLRRLPADHEWHSYRRVV